MALLRRAFERAGVSKSDLAQRLGWMRPDIARVNRALGYRTDNLCDPRRPPRKRTSYELALTICLALGASPTDCDV